jgi:hypothetical protein
VTHNRIDPPAPHQNAATDELGFLMQACSENKALGVGVEDPEFAVPSSLSYATDAAIRTRMNATASDNRADRDAILTV